MGDGRGFAGELCRVAVVLAGGDAAGNDGALFGVQHHEASRNHHALHCFLGRRKHATREMLAVFCAEERSDTAEGTGLLRESVDDADAIDGGNGRTMLCAPGAVVKANPKRSRDGVTLVVYYDCAKCRLRHQRRQCPNCKSYNYTAIAKHWREKLTKG